MYKLKFINLLKKLNPHYGLRNNDIIFASFPKSGNSWFRFIWYNIISLNELGGKEINFHNLNSDLGAQYDSHTFGSLDYKILPRLVKTHRVYHNFFSKYNNIFLYRDPRDVMVSFFYYLNSRNKSNSDFDSISSFIRSKKYGIESWCMHYNKWINNTNFSFSYEDLRESEQNVLFEIIKHFNLSNIKHDLIIEAIDRSKFNNIRSIEEIKGRPSIDSGEFDKSYKFTRSGKSGEWNELMTHNDLEFIYYTLQKYKIETNKVLKYD